MSGDRREKEFSLSRQYFYCTDVIMREIIVALSGGVDSGVAAALLLDTGANVRGLFMRHRFQKTLDRLETRTFLEDNRGQDFIEVYSVGAQNRVIRVNWTPEDFPFLLPVDFVSAVAVARHLNIKLILLDIENSFISIVDNFVKEYYEAHTPNPCVLCNRYIKFGLLWQIAQELGANFLATGHYVRIKRVCDWLDLQSEENKIVDAFFNFGDIKDYHSIPDWLLDDKNSVFFSRSLSEKDQSYFLYNVAAEVLPSIVFPVGGYTKEKVRKIAVEKGLPVAARKDSQEICFIPTGKRLEFIHDYCQCKPELSSYLDSDTSGVFLSLDGKVIGKHCGYEKYTIGQRKGLGMGFCKRVFVQRINSTTREITLGPYESLETRKVCAVDSNWHVLPPINKEFRCEVKVRYRNESSMATVKVAQDGSFEAVFDQARYGVAPGQALVCYWRDRLLGGGRIIL